MPSRKREPTLVALSHLQLDDASEQTLRRSLYVCVRDAILEERLKTGTRLPSTRQLAAQLSISRNTVSDVFAQLIAEGFLVARHGSGTFVAMIEAAIKPAGPARSSWVRASARGQLLVSRFVEDDLQGLRSVPFQPGVPSYELFPHDIWARIAAPILRNPRPEYLGYGHSAGLRPLREAIAAELRLRDGASCRDEQIIIVGGTSQALDLVCRLLVDSGDDVWIEDPSSLYVRATLTGAGANLVPVPVDDDGIVVHAGVERSPCARMAHVTSAHQWPLGPTMSEDRRLELLRWADRADAWIVEDEYDGVFRYDGERPKSLRALDENNRVIAIGSFSITMFPSLRIGYVVAPPELVDPFLAAKATADRQASVLEQAILAGFIYDGHYARYRTTMEAVYRDRQEALIERIKEYGGPVPRWTPSGLHVILPLAADDDDRALSEAARRAGIPAPALSTHYLLEKQRKGLILGFGAGTRAAMESAAARLCEVAAVRTRVDL